MLAEIDPDHDFVLQIDEDKVASKRLHGLKERDENGTVTAVKEIFHVVLDYLRNYYKEDYQRIENMCIGPDQHHHVVGRGGGQEAGSLLAVVRQK